MKTTKQSIPVNARLKSTLIGMSTQDTCILSVQNMLHPDQHRREQKCLLPNMGEQSNLNISDPQTKSDRMRA